MNEFDVIAKADDLIARSDEVIRQVDALVGDIMDTLTKETEVAS